MKNHFPFFQVQKQTLGIFLWLSQQHQWSCLHVFIFLFFSPLKELIIFNPLWRYTRTRTCTIIFLFFPPEILPSYQSRGTCLMQYLMYILLSLHLWLFGPFPCDGRSRMKEHLPSFDCRFEFTTTFWYYIWDGFLQHWWHVKVGCGVCVGAKNILSLKDRLNFTAMKRLQKLPRKGISFFNLFPFPFRYGFVHTAFFIAHNCHWQCLHVIALEFFYVKLKNSQCFHAFDQLLSQPKNPSTLD